MITMLLVAEKKENFADFETGLKNIKDVNIIWVNSLFDVLNTLSNEPVDVVVADVMVNGVGSLEMIRKIVTTFPMVNTAAVSSLTADEFHESSEGLGILLQLPVNPGEKEGKFLLDQLRKVLILTSAGTKNRLGRTVS